MGKNIANTTHTFFFCDGGSCQKAGSEQVTRAARAYLRNNNLWDKTHTIKTRCNGRCEDAPTCIVQPGEFWYKELTPEKITPIVKAHINNEPFNEDNLLYKKGWNEQVSNNERAPIKPKPFELKNDAELGDCYITRGFSSDQYLYPLFLYLSENSKGATLTFSNNSTVSFDKIIAVNYVHRYNLELKTKTDTFAFTIASVPKENKELQQSKIASTEYFYQTETALTGIRFKNKFGITLGKVTFDSIENKAWLYCTKIQLQNTNLHLK
ncbi:(2Fe-2S) ferredoxin domain-containing protein [Tenacibaculum dicentrarchi]|nr:(2Fe-2S) ferredoxin domain-containing protein [Tenacibaculum dicentrarchi]MCD8414619.1 (2Fe-2S) ferredoxin domain-containing protein [Tenacibaculum dicentrarchi]MCD8419862.1 (2Fe-2S) ferredoxin domain-containing protein [Tenacibaculum dicentrarchi]MCD8437128.1 (2Fe-2S) ferredoxin domain-containing protein [Tenacibaculum dicentrarchi]MCD8452187.1 (2Fe-2S) ferredoxin domain-containing protein [Tenacibaculum dicentrarchi]